MIFFRKIFENIQIEVFIKIPLVSVRVSFQTFKVSSAIKLKNVMLRHRARGPDVSKERVASGRFFRNAWKQSPSDVASQSRKQASSGESFSFFFYVVYAWSHQHAEQNFEN